MASVDTTVLLFDSEKRPTRRELDAGLVNIWAKDGPIERVFNSDHVFDGRDEPSSIMSFDANLHAITRDGALLRTKWNEVRGRFTVAYNNWSASGQNDPDCFENFVDGAKAWVSVGHVRWLCSQIFRSSSLAGNLVLLYMFVAFREHPSLEPFVLRTIDTRVLREDGVGVDDTDSENEMDITGTGPGRRSASSSGRNSLTRSIIDSASASTAAPATPLARAGPPRKKAAMLPVSPSPAQPIAIKIDTGVSASEEAMFRARENEAIAATELSREKAQQVREDSALRARQAKLAELEQLNKMVATTSVEAVRTKLDKQIAKLLAELYPDD